MRAVLRLSDGRGRVLGARRVALAVVVAGALVLRVVLALVAPLPAVAGDPAMYDELAVSVASGHGFARLPRRVGGERPATALHPPGWPFVLAGAYAVSGHTRPAEQLRARTGHGVRPRAVTAARWRSARVVQAVLGAAAVALVGLVAGQLWGAGVGLVAAALAALYPPLVVLGLSLLCEPLFVTLVLAALAAVLGYRRAPHAHRWLLLAGVLVGLATLTRSNGFVLVVPLAAGVWIARPRRSLRALAAPVGLVAVALAVVAPWTIRNALTMHAAVPVATNVGKTLAGTYNATAARSHYRWRTPRKLPARRRAELRRLGEARASHALTVDAVRYVRRHPRAVLVAMAWNTWRMTELGGISRGILASETGARSLATVSLMGFIIVALLAVAGALTRRARRIPAFVWACPVALWLSVAPFAVNFSRFRAPLDPFLILLAALAVCAAGERAAGNHAQRRRRRPTPGDAVTTEHRSAASALP